MSESLKPLEGFEFLKYLSKYPFIKKNCKGIFSIDNLPKRLKYREYVICNTSPSSVYNGHWFVLLQNSINKEKELFDSVGVTEEKLKLYETYFPPWQIEYNKTQFQSSLSSTCGHYVLYFIIQRMLNLDLEFEDFIETFFVPDINKNEIMVKNFFAEIQKEN